MKIPNWLYPKEITKVKYWAHWLLGAFYLITLTAIASFFFPQFLGFQIETVGQYVDTLKTMFIFIALIFIASDILSHTTLQIN